MELWTGWWSQTQSSAFVFRVKMAPQLVFIITNSVPNPRPGPPVCSFYLTEENMRMQALGKAWSSVLSQEWGKEGTESIEDWDIAAKTYFSELFLSQTQPLPSVKRVADSGLRFAVGKY